MTDAFDTGWGMSWRRLLRWAAISGVVEYVVVLLSAGEVIPPLIVIGLLLVAGAVWLRKPGRGPVIFTLVAFVLFLVSNLAFAWRDLTETRSFPSFGVSAAALATALLGLTAAIAALRGDGDAERPLARSLTLAGGAAIVAFVAVNAIGSITYDDATPGSGDVTLVAKDTEWSTTTLSASAGDVTFFLRNRDAVTHNFHIEGVGTASLPAAHQTRKTFTLVAGSFKYVCDYHTDMKGTLTVT
jgi:plastocyanin